MSILDINGHKLLVEISRSDIGLYAYIAIHNDILGPAVGGTRMYPYNSKEDAIRDVLQLSKAMTYKCALAGVRFGGGKGVIIGNPQVDKRRVLLEAYTEEINKLSGQFYTGEDVGLSEVDVDFMAQKSNFFIGLSNKAGSPSSFAALSTFVTMKYVYSEKMGYDSLKDCRVAIKGVGKVGKILVRLLKNEGAHIMISDIDQDALDEVQKSCSEITIVHPHEINKIDCDIYVPCALGNELTRSSIKELKTKIICGVANNQLASEEVGDILYQEGIVYVPDYIANAGGLINVVEELSPGGWDPARVMSKINKIPRVLSYILKKSEEDNTPPFRVADWVAEKILEDAKKGRHAEIYEYLG